MMQPKRKRLLHRISALLREKLRAVWQQWIVKNRVLVPTESIPKSPFGSPQQSEATFAEMQRDLKSTAEVPETEARERVPVDCRTQ